MSAAAMLGVPDDACATCQKTTDLQRCTKCKSIKYCSKDCQKKGWKGHKKICPLLAQMKANTQDAHPDPSGSAGLGSSAATGTAKLKNLETHIEKPFAKLDNGTWLHGRSEKDTFQLLIDSFRLREDDEYTFKGDASMDSVYDGSADSTVPFKSFLNEVEEKEGYLPDWWNEAKRKECVKFGMRKNQWASLRQAVTKSGIIEYYGSPTMPMQLRMFAEEVLGSSISNIGGAKAMRQFQMMQESGASELDGLDIAHLNLGRS